jgi:hypothetical protein
MLYDINNVELIKIESRPGISSGHCYLLYFRILLYVIGRVTKLYLLCGTELACYPRSGSWDRQAYFVLRMMHRTKYTA